MNLSHALLVVLLGNTTAALAAPVDPLHPEKNRGKIIRIADDEDDDTEEDDDDTTWTKLGCVDTERECRKMAAARGWRHVDASAEAESCPNTALTCYAKP